MRICHFSDWHWAFPLPKLPEADLYVCTGDMLPNEPFWPEVGCGMRIDPKHERRFQTRSIHKFLMNSDFREYLGSPESPIVVVKGNHDFISIGTLFMRCNLVHEFNNNELVEVAGLKVTGHRGIPWIYGGWDDEMARADLQDRVRRMPTADLYLTHYPPLDTLDGPRRGWGLDGMLNELLYRHESEPGAFPSSIHCFGHIHEDGGKTLVAGHMMFSNAATGWNLIEGDPQAGWRDISPP